MVLSPRNVVKIKEGTVAAYVRGTPEVAAAIVQEHEFTIPVVIDPTDSLWNPLRDKWCMHVGDTWVSLAELGMEHPEDGCQVVPRAAGQTTLFFSGSTCTLDSSQAFPTDLWIISLDS